jgi:hypothetical protein
MDREATLGVGGLIYGARWIAIVFIMMSSVPTASAQSEISSPTITALRETAATGTLAQWFEIARRGRRQCAVTLDGMTVFAGGCSFASSASTANVHLDNDKCWIDVGFTTKTRAWATIEPGMVSRTCGRRKFTAAERSMRFDDMVADGECFADNRFRICVTA